MPSSFREVKRKEKVTSMGIKGYSPLLDLNNPFDIVKDVVPDEFHLVREGITKQLLLRLANSKSQAFETVWSAFNDVYQDMRVFAELGWRTRSLENFAFFKGKRFSSVMQYYND